MKLIYKVVFILFIGLFFVSCKPSPYTKYKPTKKALVKIHGQKVKPSKEVLEIEEGKAAQRALDKERLSHNRRVQNARNKKRVINVKKENAPFGHH